MNTHSHFEPTTTRPFSRGFQTLLLAGAIAVFLLILLGGMARVTGSGGACLDWPTCFGQFTPPDNGNALIDYLHRFVTLVATALILASTAIAWKRYRDDRVVLAALNITEDLFKEKEKGSQLVSSLEYELSKITNYLDTSINSTES